MIVVCELEPRRGRWNDVSIDRAATAFMERLQTTSTLALQQILDGQPLSRAKVAFAWKIAAGPALARAASPELREDGTLVLRARTAAWLKELRHARPILRERLQGLLGATTVKQIAIEPEGAPHA